MHLRRAYWLRREGLYQRMKGRLHCLPARRLLACAALLLLVFARPLSAQISKTTTNKGFEGIPLAPDTGATGPYGQPRESGSFKDQAIITSPDIFQTEDDWNIAYAKGRTKVQFNDFTLEADRMVIDFVSEDIQAEGNVIFTGPNEFIKATAGRFNLSKGEGVGYGVDGQSGDFFFRAHWDEEKKGPSFRQINGDESVFRGTRFTSCDFPVPMYYITATEVIFIKGERVSFRNPVVHIRDVPVFWLPFYTRHLDEGSPWFMEFGFGSKLGAYYRLGYRYIHQVKTPSFEDPKKYEVRTHGQADTVVDLMASRGIGVGTHYDYQFDYNRHTGSLEVYGLRDTARTVRDEANDGVTDRWVYRHKHNSLLTDSLIFQLDVDEASDPDVYVDVLDRFALDTQFERGRLFERRARTALTFRDDERIARILFEQRERLGRDKYTDPSDPYDDDLDFDPDPNFTDGKKFKDNGISKSRFGTVAERGIARYSTRLLKFGSAPLFYRYKANAFTALDSGLNTLGTQDDERVNGVDLWTGLLNRVRLGSRTTWTNQIGVGAALYDRESNNIIDRDDFKAGLVGPKSGKYVDNSRFSNDHTIILGDGDTHRDMKDVDSFYLFGDYESRLNHRFTDFLDAYVQYKFRRGTRDSLGEYYESIGRQEAAQDIYDFYTDQHLIEAGSNFFLRYPNLSTNVRAGQNLQGDDQIYPNELVRYAGIVTNYLNPTGEFSASAGLDYQERQIRDRDDPNEFRQPSLNPTLRLAYFPRHARYWAQLNVTGSYKLQDDPVSRDNRQKRRFDENRDDLNIGPTVGRQFGPKYRVQVGGTYNTRYENWRRFGVTILRDLHDAELGLFLGVKNNSFATRHNNDDTKSSSAETQTAYEYELRTSLRFKINRDSPGMGSRSITTLSDLRREAQYVQ